jgi:hypothetical protein
VWAAAELISEAPSAKSNEERDMGGEGGVFDLFGESDE